MTEYDIFIQMFPVETCHVALPPLGHLCGKLQENYRVPLFSYGLLRIYSGVELTDRFLFWIYSGLKSNGLELDLSINLYARLCPTSVSARSLKLSNVAPAS